MSIDIHSIHTGPLFHEKIEPSPKGISAGNTAGVETLDKTNYLKLRFFAFLTFCLLNDSVHQKNKKTKQQQRINQH